MIRNVKFGADVSHRIFLWSPSSILTNQYEISSHCCTSDAICLQSYYFQRMVLTSYFIITEKYCVLCGQQIAPVLPKIRNILQNRVLASYLLWTSIEHCIWLNYWLQELHDVVDLKFWAEPCREKKSCLWIGCVVDYSPFWFVFRTVRIQALDLILQELDPFQLVSYKKQMESFVQLETLQSRTCKVWFLFFSVHFLYKQRRFLMIFASVK